MLLYLGGAARAGKGILVRRLLAELGLPYLSLDVLKMGLTRGLPELAFDPDAGGLRVAERMWPLVREMSMSLFRDGVDYVFEGEILPKDVAALRELYPTRVKACFLGYSAIAPNHKLREIREHSGYPNDWAEGMTDVALLAIIQREIGFSQYLQAECARLNFPYFDLSTRFMSVLDSVVEFVRGGQKD